MNKNLSLLPAERIEQIIYVIRGYRVMLDRDLAKLYGVLTKALLQAVKRNIKRFPEDFMFQLSWGEAQRLRSQFVTLDEKQPAGRGRYSKYRPYAFTEHGVVMLANVLRSERAALISIEVARAFIRLRQTLASHHELTKEMVDLKSFVLKHAQKSDQEFRKVWRAIEKLSMPPPKEECKMGFKLD
ncbi:MAG: ORF6N domain-containing protein [Candidatus Peregrinibacteria bacterium]